MSETKPGIYLVRDVEQAIQVAIRLGATAIGFDIEGVLEPFRGNDPQAMPKFTGFHNNTENVAAARRSGELSIPVGLMTNNTNVHLPDRDAGLVDLVAGRLGGIDSVPYVHRGMLLPDGTIMGKKPTGVQGVELTKRLDSNPVKTVLIDDQGVKNFGEVVKAGFQALIVPDPIGFEDDRGRVIEHPGVMKLRLVEPLIYRSLKSRGPRVAAALAYRAVAGVSISDIGHFEDLRAA